MISIDRNVLLVEDIVDSGYTIASVLDFLQTRHPKSLRVCTLLDKAERREVHGADRLLRVSPSRINSSSGTGWTWTNTTATCPSSPRST